jgi:hypothetical protein
MLSRKYTHKYTRDEVTILLLCGRPGPISIHTPDICYTGAGFVMGPIQEEQLVHNGSTWVADFKKNGTPPQTLRIRWAWSTGGDWISAHSPRIEFSRKHVLYKVYFVRQIRSAQTNVRSDADKVFANEFLSAVQSYLLQLR